MKSFVVLAFLVAAAAAAPQYVRSPDADAQVLRYESDNIGTDGFNYAYETTNGLQAQAQGVLKNIGAENPALEVRGSYSYPGPDGQIYTVTYIANELGFQPSAPHLPVAPSA